MNIVKLGEVCKIVSGGTPTRSMPEFWENGTIPWIKIGDITKKHVDNASEFITTAGLNKSSAKILPRGTILYTIFATLGEVGILDIEACTNQAIAGIIIKNPDQILVDYLYFFLLSKKDYVKGIGRGVAQNNINMSLLRDYDIPLSCMQKQNEIVSVLNKVNQLLEMRRRQLQLLDDLVKSRFIEMFGDPIKNDKGWPIARLDEVAEIKIGPFGSLLHREDYIEGGHALVNPSHIIEGHIVTDPKLTISEEKFEALSSYELRIGDIVLGRRGEMGRCAVVYDSGMLCGTGSMIIRSGRKMKSYFLQNIISSPGYKKLIEDKAVGVTMMNLNVPTVSALTVPLLPIDLQDKYLEFVDQSDKSKFIIQQSIDKLETLQKALMQKYFG